MVIESAISHLRRRSVLIPVSRAVVAIFFTVSLLSAPVSRAQNVDDALLSRLATVERSVKAFGDDDKSAKRRTRIFFEPVLPETVPEVLLREVEFSGATHDELQFLNDVLDPYIGTRINKDQLSQILNDLNTKRRPEGTLLRTIYVPPQALDDGALQLAFARPQLGRLEIDGASAAERRKIRSLAERELSVFTRSNLERFADQASDLLKRSVDLAVGPVPGDVGTLVRVDAAPRVFKAELGIDNYAPFFVSREAISTNFEVNSLLKAGDEFSIYASLTPDFDQLRFYSFKYDVPLFTGGPHLIVGAGRFQLDPGIDFLRDLGFELQSDYTSIHLEQPLIESQNVSIDVHSGLVRRAITRDITGTPTADITIWNADLGLSLELETERWGETEFSVLYRRTVDIFDASARNLPTTLRRDLGPGQTGWQFDFEHTIDVSPVSALTFAFYKQLATGPLVGPDQCEYGGGPFGRGYDLIELNGDACFLAFAEFKTAPGWLQVGTLHPELIFAADYGTLSLRSAPDPNAPVVQQLQSERQSVAVGLEVEFADRFTGTFFLAKPFQRSSVFGLEDNDFRYTFRLEAEF